MIIKKLIFVFIIIAAYNISYAQASLPDTTQISRENKSNSFTSIFYGEPGKAALIALGIPGGGQAYNKKYWKVPIALTIEYFAIKNLTESISEVRSLSECRRSYIEADPTPSDQCIRVDDMMNQTIITENDVFGEWNDARGSKETAWLIMGGAHLLTIVEAFVDRHLINFDTDEDLSYHNLHQNDNGFVPPQIDIVTMRIPLNKSKVSR